MTDTNLDRAAQMAGYDDWGDVTFKVGFAAKSIQAHAATLNELDAAKAELEAFKREVSDKAAEAISIAMKAGYACERGPAISAILSSFILPKPDPLVEVLKEADAPSLGDDGYEAMADRVHAALAKHGLRLERIEHE